MASLNAAFADAEIRSATSLEAALESPQGLSEKDLVLLEPALRGRLGLEVLTRLRILRPEVPVAVRSANTSRTSICAALSAGIRGYFPKTLRAQLVVAGLQYIAAGGVFVPQEVLDKARADEQPFPFASHALTPSQTRVLQVLLTGRSNREIGRELNISEGTVKQHLYALYRTAGVTSRGIPPNSRTLA